MSRLDQLRKKQAARKAKRLVVCFRRSDWQEIGVEAFELDPRGGSGETPIDAGGLSVAGLLPSSHFSLQQLATHRLVDSRYGREMPSSAAR